MSQETTLEISLDFVFFAPRSRYGGVLHGDGLSDGEEVEGYEYTDGVSVVTDPTVVDTDRDGLTDGDEADGVYVNYNTYVLNALSVDTDGDGLNDYFEVKGWDVTLLSGYSGRVIMKWHVYGDPLDCQDRDGDGYNDLYEFLNHTDPDNADTDGDMISDNLEITSYTNTKDLEYSPVVTDNIGPELNVNIWRTFAGAGWADMKITVSASDDSGLAYLKLKIVERSIMGGEQTIVEKKLEYWDNNIWSNSVKVARIENVEFTIYASASYDIYVEACDHNGNFAEYHNHWTGIVEAIVKGLKEIKNTIKDALNFLKNSVLNTFMDMMRPRIRKAIELKVNPWELDVSRELRASREFGDSPSLEDLTNFMDEVWAMFAIMSFVLPFQMTGVVSAREMSGSVVGFMSQTVKEANKLYNLSKLQVKFAESFISALTIFFLMLVAAGTGNAAAVFVLLIPYAFVCAFMYWEIYEMYQVVEDP